MKYLKFIMLCALMSISAAYAAEKPNVIGFHIGMTREQADAHCYQLNQQGAYLTITPFIPIDPMQQIQLDNMMIGLDVNYSMEYEYMRMFDVTYWASACMAGGNRPVILNTHPNICNNLKKQKLCQVKPDNYCVLRDARGLGVMMLGFSGNAIVEITVSPLMFNWLSYPPQRIADMISQTWNVKMICDNSNSYNPQWQAINNDYIIAVTSNQMLYIGKMVSEQSALPSMNMQRSNTQYYNCLACRYPQPMPGGNIISGGGMMPVPSPYNNGYQPARPKQQMPCHGCNGSGKSHRYIEAPVYTGEAIYSWCDTCKMEVKSHTHHDCTICRGTGYITR